MLIFLQAENFLDVAFDRSAAGAVVLLFQLWYAKQCTTPATPFDKIQTIISARLSLDIREQSSHEEQGDDDMRVAILVILEGSKLEASTRRLETQDVQALGQVPGQEMSSTLPLYHLPSATARAHTSGPVQNHRASF